MISVAFILFSTSVTLESDASLVFRTKLLASIALSFVSAKFISAKLSTVFLVRPAI